MSGTESSKLGSGASSLTRRRGASRNGAILVTGAGGEMGHGLLQAIAAEREAHRVRGESFPTVVAIDLRELPEVLDFVFSRIGCFEDVRYQKATIKG